MSCDKIGCRVIVVVARYKMLLVEYSVVWSRPLCGVDPLSASIVLVRAQLMWPVGGAFFVLQQVDSITFYGTGKWCLDWVFRSFYLFVCACKSRSEHWLHAKVLLEQIQINVWNLLRSFLTVCATKYVSLVSFTIGTWFYSIFLIFITRIADSILLLYYKVTQNGPPSSYETF